MSGRILVAGIGNIFLGDDAFGVEVAGLLAKRTLPHHVCLADYGIRGLDLVYALLDPWDAVVLIDAMPRGEPPGTLFVIEPDAADLVAPADANLAIDGHQMDPVRVLRLATALGGQLKRVLIVGCEPGPLGGEEMQSGLCLSVAAAVPRAAELVESLVCDLMQTSSREAAVRT